jgi:nucleoside-diphosphate-sugar epimerase
MIIGSGLVGRAFAPEFPNNNVCIYAAGVSNSSCSDTHEFLREQQRLTQALEEFQHADAFVYFGTCSVADPEANKKPYVQHKLNMERLVSEHPRHLIVRLPQLAGKTSNPHTLLNHLYECISLGKTFSLWRNAYRNIIDVDDVVPIARYFIVDLALRNTAINIANPVNYPMTEVLNAMEIVVGKRASINVIKRGSNYPIDTKLMQSVLNEVGVNFGNDYLERVIGKYYGTS